MPETGRKRRAQLEWVATRRTHASGRPRNTIPVLIFAVLVLVALAATAGYVLGARRRASPPPQPSLPPSLPAPAEVAIAPAEPASGTDAERARVDQEKARIIRSIAAEAFLLRNRQDERIRTPDDLGRAASVPEGFEAELAAARLETARYRQLVVDIENSAPPPILMGIAEPDDLKLIVGIGPVLERMLRNLGIGTFRQIARWTPREIAEFDARLPEFPGRIVRDQWVTQARALHESKYGESPLGR
jgi:predicted flap endonuclease-1-like 5' DNA nuclease